jgi:lysozyme
MTPSGIDILKRHEGLRLKTYLCPAGVLTIGYGHTKGVTEGMEITIEEADRLLHEDVAGAEWDVRQRVENFDMISPRRQDALINMAFNLGGTGFGKFKTFLRAVRAGEWKAASAALEFSKWYGQVHGRAKDIQQMILQG